MNTTLPIKITDTLLIRHPTEADIEPLADFNSRVHSDDGWEEPEVWLGHWTRGLLDGSHPYVGFEDFIVVEDTETRKIVSTLMVIPQTWTYGGVIDFKVGRIELVATHPDYRRKGLIRKQFDVMHAICAERGYPVQGITGIPWYYRMFGYEMTLALEGGRGMQLDAVPKLKEDESEPFIIRPATLDDIPILKTLQAQNGQRSAIALLRDDTLWQYELEGKSRKYAYIYRVIEDQKGTVIGYFSHAHELWGSRLFTFEYEVLAGHDWHATLPSVLRYLKAMGEAFAKKEKDDHPGFHHLRLNLGAQHPIYTLRPDLLKQQFNPYAWYIRVSNVREFIEQIRPVLEDRLANSPLAGYTREIRISFYHSGLKLKFENGKLTAVEDWRPEQSEGEVRFPDLTFYHLLFQHRSYTEIEQAYADCYGGAEIPALMDILFPKQPSRFVALN